MRFSILPHASHVNPAHRPQRVAFKEILPMRCASFVVVLGCCLAGALHGQELPTRSEHGRELIAVSNASSLGKLLPELDRIMGWSLASAPAGGAAERLASMSSEAFPSDSIVSSLLKTCEGRYNGSVFEEIIGWFRSPLGQKVAQADQSVAVMLPPQRSEVRERVRAEWVSNRRLLLLGRLDDNLGLGTVQGLYALRLMEDLLLSLRKENPTATEWSDERVQDAVERAVNRLESCLRDSVVFDLRVTYRFLSNDELQRYNEFLETFGGRWYTELVREGLEDAFVAGRERFVTHTSAIPISIRRTLVP